MGLFIVTGAPAPAQLRRPFERRGGPVAENPGPVAQAVRKRLLTGIALYPDEIVAAIFEVSQSPQTLVSGTPASDSGYRASLALLQDQPAVLANLRDHPGSTAAIGEMARRDIDGCWATIDEIRRESGWTRPAQVVVVSAPVAVAPVAVVVAGPGAAHAGGGVVVTTQATGAQAYARRGQAAASPESFSMKGLDSAALASSMERASAQNRKVFSDNERGMAGGGRGGRRK